jgi:signal transduction histidine kinase
MERLRILLLEDSPLDAELILMRLTEAGIACAPVRVETRADYLAELERDRFDLILADYSLPSFDGGSALAIARARCPEVPFIFVSGALGEELAIDILKDGATDYVLKQRLERLVPSIERALREAEERAERRRLEEELCRRAEELAERDRRKDEFLAVLAHELRNPLGASSNALQLMRRRGPSDPALRQAITVMERQVQHQVRLVDDLLDVSRITRGKISLEREWLDLAWVIRHTVEDHRSVLEAAGLTLFLNLPHEPVWFAGDRTRLTQVLGNLLANAAKFTNAGGCVTVSLTLEADGSQAVLAVRDTGIGIDPQMLLHVFESFAQGDHNPERSRGGLGLGLALVKGLVELHGGAVRADSPGLGSGSEFTLTLPLAPEAAICTEVALPPGPPVRCCRILVVEDNRDAAETLRDVLELSGHQVTLAFSGPEGVAAARRVQPEVVLCDIGLPGFDGYAVARALRQDQATAAAHLVALTGYGHEEDRCRSLEAGFEQYLVKPVNFADLERLLAVGPPARLP